MLVVRDLPGLFSEAKRNVKKRKTTREKMME